MPASETRIPVSKDTRRDLRLIKATEGYETYDEALATLVDAYGGMDV